MLLVAMVLGMLLIRKVPEKWFRFLFLACILLNVIYRIEFLSPALAGGVRSVCKSMELVLLIVAFKVFDKRPVYLSIGVFSLLFFGVYTIPVSVILENGGMSGIYSAYGISGKGVAKGIRLIESVKTLCLSLVYLSLDVRIFLNMKGKETRR